MRVLLPIFVLLAGCVSKPINEPDVPGYYSSVSGFSSPRSLELKRNNTFGYVQYTRESQEKADGTIVFEAWSYSGKWQFVPPDRIELQPSGAPKIDLFIRRSPNYGLVILEPHLISDILSTWSTDTGPLSMRLLKKRKQPNTLSAPTSTPVRSPAAQESRRP